MTPRQVEDEIVAIIGIYAGQLPCGQAEEFQDLARHNEWLVALEMFCDQLWELSIPLSSSCFERICAVAQHLGIHPDYLCDISKLVTPASRAGN